VHNLCELIFHIPSQKPILPATVNCNEIAVQLSALLGQFQEFASVNQKSQIGTATFLPITIWDGLNGG
jgi:hypothetical protein